jgi:hypothetical protein
MANDTQHYNNIIHAQEDQLSKKWCMMAKKKKERNS